MPTAPPDASVHTHPTGGPDTQGRTDPVTQRTIKGEPFGGVSGPSPADTEFNRKYAQDPFGREMEGNSRVWRVYRDEATEVDKTKLDGWNKTLDILLIFAGLFSAVVTSFVVDSYKNLQPDMQDYIANALYADYVARNTNGPVPVVPSPDDFATTFSASLSSLWINGLWFTSLVIALSVALLCILVKQWLEEYTARMVKRAETQRHWAHRRVLFSRGIEKWRVEEFISLLPLALHVALFLFFAGLVLLLWSLSILMAGWVLACAVSLGLFYATVTVLPLWNIECPTSTPFLRHVKAIPFLLGILGLHCLKPVLHYGARLRFYLCDNQRSQPALDPSLHRDWALMIHDPRDSRESALDRLVTRLRKRVEEARDERFRDTRPEFDYAVLQMVIDNPSPEVASVGAQAISDIRPSSPLGFDLRSDTKIYRRTLELMRHYTRTYVPHASLAADVSRDVRASLCLGRLVWNDPEDLPFSPAMQCSDDNGLAFLRPILESAFRGPTTEELDCLSGKELAANTTMQLICGVDLSLNMVLRILAYTALKDLTAEDWSYIYRLLRFGNNGRASETILYNAYPYLTMHIRQYRLPDNLHTSAGHECTIYCSIDILVALVQSQQSLHLSDDDVSALRHIMRQFSGHAHDAGFFNIPSPGFHLGQLPSLSQFIASDTSFLELPCSLETMFIILQLAADPDEWMPVVDPKIIPSIVHALSRCFGMREVSAGITSAEGAFYRRACPVLAHLLKAWLRVELSSQSTCAPASFLLDPANWHDGSTTILQFLLNAKRSVWPKPPIALADLADALARSLHRSARRGIDVTDMLQGFLTTAMSGIMLANIFSSDRAERIILSISYHCIRHCELWWTEFSHSRDIQRNPLALRALRIIDTQLSHYPPCADPCCIDAPAPAIPSDRRGSTSAINDVQT